MVESPLPAPLVHPGRRGSPVFLSVPHAGRDVPRWLVYKAVRGRRGIEGQADPWVDALVAPLFEEGFGGVVAQAPRSAIDCNRGLKELDPDLHADAPPAPAGSKAARGLGLVIASDSSGGSMWKAPLDGGDLQCRIDSAWRPYHAALAAELAAVRASLGIAVLLDCHSMPPRRRGLPRIVLGDRNGTSAAPWVIAIAGRAAERLGEPVAINRPYAGGEIVRTHGDPARGVHALQVEIDRSLYLDSSLVRPGPGMRRGAAIFAAIAHALEEAVEVEVARAAAE